MPADRAVHVGSRLDSDIRPPKRLGMRTVWLLRGESPPAPTVEQLSAPDAVVTSFSGVPNALAGMANRVAVQGDNGSRRSPTRRRPAVPTSPMEVRQ